MHAFAVGDVLRFDRGEFSHLAIFVGDGRVIHLWSPTNDGAFHVRIDTIRYVLLCQRNVDDDPATPPPSPLHYTAAMDARMQRDHSATPFSGEEVVRRARTRLGETRYDLLSYNCEHFVTWARYDVGASPQAASHTNDVIAGALLGAAVGGMAGLVVGGAISLFRKYTALSASAAGAASAGLLTATSAPSGGIDHHDEAEGESDDRAHRRQDRERLVARIEEMELTSDEPSHQDFDTWVSSRRRDRMNSIARQYSDERHEALAMRLAEDKLLCGICFYDLQLTRAVAFTCDHFTCLRCYDALVANRNGHKCCPYCRLPITETQLIHRSTKLLASDRLEGREDLGD
ncbi:hypothetical protein ATCC90586_007217 [Pythium insidiosum]|nr:hypothetical protein ATCC90586_007217 [Pythium insidiosum]